MRREHHKGHKAAMKEAKVAAGKEARPSDEGERATHIGHKKALRSARREGSINQYEDQGLPPTEDRNSDMAMKDHKEIPPIGEKASGYRLVEQAKNVKLRKGTR